RRERESGRATPAGPTEQGSSLRPAQTPEVKRDGAEASAQIKDEVAEDERPLSHWLLLALRFSRRDCPYRPAVTSWRPCRPRSRKAFSRARRSPVEEQRRWHRPARERRSSDKDSRRDVPPC